MKRNGERTVQWQEWMLARMVEPAFVRKTQGVKGPYTTGDFVTFLLNDIFGPSNWSHRILKGPELIQYGDQMAYSQVTVQLTVRFADGREAIHEDIGIWPFTATKAREGGTLEKTKPERFEQVVKSAVTDGLKACTDHLGNCFRPIADLELEGFLRRRQAEESLEEKKLSAKGEPAEKSNNDLFGEEPGPAPALHPPAPKAKVPAPPAEADDGGPRTMTELYDKAAAFGVDKDAAMQRIVENTELSSVKEAVDTGWTAPELWEECFSDLS